MGTPVGRERRDGGGDSWGARGGVRLLYIMALVPAAPIAPCSKRLFSSRLDRASLIWIVALDQMLLTF